MMKMSPRALARAMQRRTTTGAPDDEGIALLTVIMLIMVMAALSVLLLGVVVSQVKPTLFADKNSRTVSAAEAGIDAALSQMRSANGAPDINGKIYGDSTKLPCTVQGPVDGASATLTYKVTVSYFDQDPTGTSAAWRAANQLTCSTGVLIAPSFAILSSQGLDAGIAGLAAKSGNRTIETMYTFQVTHNNIAGGTIYAFGDKHCLQASGQTSGSGVTYVDAAQCGADDPRQLWTYGKDYAIHLSVTDLGSTPLCLTGNSSTGGNIAVTLTACTTNNTNQMFSWQGGAQWNGENSAKTDYSNLCLSAGAVYSDADLVGKPLKYGSCLAGNIASGSYDPDPRVGAGAASKATNQIVNSLEFGRCMDVTGEDITSSFMIDYPCKQDPSGGSKLNWNHKWSYTEPTGTLGSLGPQQISVKNGGSHGVSGATYCLKAPDASASPQYVTMVTPCDASSPSQKWFRNAQMSTYALSWTFTDPSGTKCITLGDKLDASWSKLLLAPCTGGPEQKWNAPTVDKAAGVSDYKELKN